MTPDPNLVQLSIKQKNVNHNLHIVNVFFRVAICQSTV